MTHNSIIDKLEEGFVFRVSRSFFLVLVLIAMLGIVAGLAYLSWGITPTSKEVVIREPTPKPVTLTVADIRAAMSKPKTEHVEKAQPVAKTETTPEKATDPDQARFQALLDTLRTLLPAKFYSWQSTGYWTYPYGKDMYDYLRTDDCRKWTVTKRGISDKLNRFYTSQALTGVSDFKEAIASLEQLCAILRDFPVDERLAPFNAFTDLYTERQSEYVRQLKENEEKCQSRLADAAIKYENTLSNKSAAKYQGLISLGAGIASVALLAIFLVLLSMQRTLKEIVLRDKQI